MKLQVASLLISTIALSMSALTAWLTLLRRGQVKMTRPSSIYFGPDGGLNGDSSPKVFLRTLLFCTSQRGQVLETMYVTLRRNETKQNFSIWVLGEEKLTRGSGLFVGEQGVVADHHFLLPKDMSAFQFLEGKYVVDVYGKILGVERSSLLFTQALVLGDSYAKQVGSGAKGVFFDWGPDSATYIPHLSERPEKARHEAVLASLRAEADQLCSTSSVKKGN